MDMENELTLKCCGVLRATSQQKHRLLVLELQAQFLDLLIHLKDLLELVRNLAQTVHDFHSSLVLACTILRQQQCEHDHAHELRGVGFGGGNTDFWSGIDVDTAMCHERDARSHSVDNAHSQSTTLQTVTKSHERICCLTRLGDEHAGVVTEDWCFSVKEVRGQLDRDRDLGKFLESSTHGHAGVVRGTAGDEYEASAATDSGEVLLKSSQCHSLLFRVQATTHSIDHGFWLLEDFFLHEVVKLALHDLLELDLQGLDSANVAGAVGLGQTVDVELTIVDVGDVVVFEVQHLLGVLDNGGWVGGKEELSWLWHAIV